MGNVLPEAADTQRPPINIFFGLREFPFVLAVDGGEVIRLEAALAVDLDFMTWIG